MVDAAAFPGDTVAVGQACRDDEDVALGDVEEVIPGAEVPLVAGYEGDLRELVGVHLDGLGALVGEAIGRGGVGREASADRGVEAPEDLLMVGLDGRRVGTLLLPRKSIPSCSFDNYILSQVG